RLSAKSIHYALTPEGLAEVARRTARYFHRAAQSAEQHGARLEMFVLRAKSAGAQTLVLAGASDLDFLLEFACDRHGLVFVRTADESRARTFAGRPGVVVVYADSAPEGSAP